MEILLNFGICENLPCFDNFEFTDSDKKNIENKVGLGRVTKVEIVNIGPGADWIVLFLVVSIGLQLIYLGKSINEGIDGWIEIGKKLKKLFKSKKIVSVDKYGATALALQLIAQKTDIVTLEMLQENTINLADVSYLIENPKNELCKSPHNYYLQSYRINGGDVFIVGIKSTGEAEIIKHFDINLNGITEIK